jgi:hypothetical protein
MATLWLIIIIAVLIVVLGIVAIFNKKKNKTPTDYKTLFTLGVVWLPFGIVMRFFGGASNSIGTIFATLGFFYLVIGLANKDKWEKRKATTKEQKRMLWFTIAGLILFIILGIIYLFLKLK